MAVWTDARAKNRLEKRNLGKVCHPDLVSRILLGETTFEEQLHDDWAYLVRDDFKPDHKITTAQRVRPSLSTANEPGRRKRSSPSQNLLMLINILRLFCGPRRNRTIDMDRKTTLRNVGRKQA